MAIKPDEQYLTIADERHRYEHAKQRRLSDSSDS